MVAIRPLSLVFLMLALLAPASASAAEPTARIIVKREPGLNAHERADIRADAGVRLVDTLSLPRTEVVTAPAAKATAALRVLNADDDVVYAEVDHVRHLTAALPDDSLFSYVWGMNNAGQSKPGYFYGGLRDADIDAPEAWAQDVTGANVQVAVVDTGVDGSNVDLDGKVALARSFLDGTLTPGADDDNSHGTHVAGTIAATRNNGRGVAGVAPDAEIMALKAMEGDTGLDSDIAEAIGYATTPDDDHAAARIVNLSLGGQDQAETIDAAIHDAPETLFVVAAGNSGADNDTHTYMPCDSLEPNVICVGASTNRDRRATFSNFGDETVDLFAPGQDIASTIPFDTYPAPDSTYYGVKSGTSMAAPHVAGVAALVLQADPAIQVSDLKAVLLASVDERPAFAGYSVTGGRLNAGLAVAYALGHGVAPPDSDGDGVLDPVDVCAGAPGTGAEGCAPADTDHDGRMDAADNCPGDANSPFTDTDQDGDGNACDDDDDGDGRLDAKDACPLVKAATANGCPVATPTPTPKPAPTVTPRPAPAPTIPDSDGDGRSNTVDACPSEKAAGTLNGCPLPAVTALSAKARKRGATLRVRTSRAATVRITVQRKRGKRWVRVASRVLAAPRLRASLKLSRLRTGRYRAVVVLSSAAGRAHAVTKGFRVR